MPLTQDEHAELQPYVDGLVGHRLFQYCVSIAGLQLDFSHPARAALTIEQALTVTRAGAAPHTDRPHSQFVLVTLVELLEQTVARTRVDLNGELTITFATGDQIQITADRNYEAWQLADERKLLIVCLPGGGISYWLPRPG